MVRIDTTRARAFYRSSLSAISRALPYQLTTIKTVKSVIVTIPPTPSASLKPPASPSQPNSNAHKVAQPAPVSCFHPPPLAAARRHNPAVLRARRRAPSASASWTSWTEIQPCRRSINPRDAQCESYCHWPSRNRRHHHRHRRSRRTQLTHSAMICTSMHPFSQPASTPRPSSPELKPPALPWSLCTHILTTGDSDVPQTQPHHHSARDPAHLTNQPTNQPTATKNQISPRHRTDRAHSPRTAPRPRPSANKTMTHDGDGTGRDRTKRAPSF